MTYQIKIYNTKHLSFFEEAQILAYIHFHNFSVTTKDLEIEKNRNNFNTIDDYKLSHSWKPLIHLLTS